MESDLEIGFKEPKWWRKSRNLIPTFRIAAAHKNQRAGKTGPRLEELKLLEVQKRLNATEGSYCDCWHDRLLYQLRHLPVLLIFSLYDLHTIVNPTGLREESFAEDHLTGPSSNCNRSYNWLRNLSKHPPLPIFSTVTRINYVWNRAKISGNLLPRSVAKIFHALLRKGYRVKDYTLRVERFTPELQRLRWVTP